MLVAFTRKRRRVLILILVSAIAILTWLYWLYRPPYLLYNHLTEEEVRSAQWALALGKKEESQENRSGKFVLFNQLQGAGFNNQVQEILLYHHLALVTSRTYIYQPFIWRPRFHQALPLSAFLPGPTRDSGVPVSLLDKVCPQDETVYVEVEAFYEDLWGTSQRILKRPERCIVITNRIMHWNYLSSSSLNQVWPSFKQYLARHFEWSPQILDIVQRSQIELGLRSTSKITGDSYMALHIRRGDFEPHCTSLASSQTPFTTWASLPILEASVLPPSLNTSDSSNIFLHCYPSLKRILAAITLQARSHPHIRTLHILHDASIDHLNVYIDILKLKTALTNHDWAERNGWGESGPMKRITDSSMIPIEYGEHDFTVAVDMELARGADVFVGNGYSSLSSQIIAMRMAMGIGTREDITLM